MDMKKMLAALDGVESAEGTASGVAQKGSMKSLLESLDSVAAEEVVAEETEEVVEATGEEVEETTDEVVEETTEEELEEAIMVSAEGDEAAELLAILQNAGMPAPAMPAPEMPAMPEPEMEMQDEYSNSPDEQEMDLDAVIASGDDMHREKDQFAAAADGDNPMKAFEGRLQSILDEMLAEDNEEATEEELEEAQSPAQKAAFEKMLAAKKGNKANDKDDDDKDDDNKEELEESYKATSEKSKFGGHRSQLKNPEGKTSYMGSASYKKPEHAKGEAQAYHDAYFGGPGKANDRGAERAVAAYRAKHKEHMNEEVKEAVAVNESADFSDMKHFMKRLNG